MGLLYTTPPARALCQRFSTVLVADCTYKTNKYKLPCFHIVGFTASNSNFTAAVGFMLRETTDWYERSLTAFLEIMGPLSIKVFLTDREPALGTALRRVLPTIKQIFCLWHIEKNISANCKTGLSGDEFNEFVHDWKKWIVEAETEESLEEGIEGIRAKYQRKRQFETILDYIAMLLHDKESYCHAWTDQHLYLGQRNTSRVEGAHRALKDSLGGSTGDFVAVIQRVRGFMNTEYKEVVQKMETQRVRTALVADRLFDTVRT